MKIRQPRNPRQGQGTAISGDINFVAACMSMGIPLYQEKPVEITKMENGREFGRFFLNSISIDGKIKLKELNQSWTNRKTDGSEKLKGFEWIMRFISNAPKGIQSTADWLDWARDYLSDGDKSKKWKWPNSLEDCENLIKANPNNMPGYVFAFVYNKWDCVRLAKEAAKDPMIYISSGQSSTQIREKAGKNKLRQFFDLIGK